MNTATIYLVTCTEAFAMYETGTRYSINPWGEDTAAYKGYDDGGKEYILPEGYSVAETVMGDTCIYDSKDRHVELVGKNTPALIDNDTWKYIALKRAS